MSTAVCSHLDTIEFTELPAPIEACAECLKVGSRWVHRAGRGQEFVRHR